MADQKIYRVTAERDTAQGHKTETFTASGDRDLQNVRDQIRKNTLHGDTVTVDVKEL